MALGWCPECARLMSIRPGPQKWGSREVEWYPREHDAPGPHKDCGGLIVDVTSTGDDSHIYQCAKCLQTANGEFDWVRCLGVQRAIK